MILIAAMLLTGCTLSKQIDIAETLVKIAMRDIGYRTEQIKAIAATHEKDDPLFSANMKDLTALMEPDAGFYNSFIDKAAAEGFADGQKLYLEK